MTRQLFTYLVIGCVCGFLVFQARAKADPALDTLACAESALQSTRQALETLQFWK